MVAPQIDSYFPTTQTALIVTDKEHIEEPQQLFERIQDELHVCPTHGNEIDDFYMNSQEPEDWRIYSIATMDSQM